MDFRGCYTAMVTPFLGTGEIDYDGLRSNVRFQIENGIQGLVPLGTTGESPTVEDDERVRIIDAVVKEAGGRVRVIPGTGTYSTAATIRFSREAEDLGADAVLVVSPYYNKPTQEGLFRHYVSVADSVGIPVIVYNIQGRTGSNVSTDTLERLSEHENIIAVKEASGDVSQMMEVIGRMADGFSVLSGDDNLTFPLLSLGGHGAISVLANLIPGDLVEMCGAALSGDMERARSIHYRLLPLFKAIFVETNPIPIKALMNWKGLPAGPYRLPLCPLQPESEERLRAVCQQSGVLT